MPQDSFHLTDWRALKTYRLTGRTRIRTGWFGFARLEEEREYPDGTRLWARVRGYRVIAE